jgi:hypothetical protein
MPAYRKVKMTVEGSKQRGCACNGCEVREDVAGCQLAQNLLPKHAPTGHLACVNDFRHVVLTVRSAVRPFPATLVTAGSVSLYRAWRSTEKA